jgi:hypothetical protein
MTSIARPASAVSVPAVAAAPSSDESLIKRIAGGDKLAIQGSAHQTSRVPRAPGRRTIFFESFIVYELRILRKLREAKLTPISSGRVSRATASPRRAKESGQLVSSP